MSARVTVRYEAGDVVIERSTDTLPGGNPRYHSDAARLAVERLLPIVLDMIDTAYGVADPIRKEGDAA